MAGEILIKDALDPTVRRARYARGVFARVRRSDRHRRRKTAETAITPEIAETAQEGFAQAQEGETQSKTQSETQSEETRRNTRRNTRAQSKETRRKTRAQIKHRQAAGSET